MTLPSRPEVVTGGATASHTGQESAPTAAGAPPRVPHHLRAWLGGLTVAVLVLLAETAGILRGPLSVVILVALLIALPIMATRPCARPIYIAALLTDKKIEAPNSWAMSLSSTWTEAASGINTYLWRYPILGDVVATADVVEELLSEDPQRCVVISPEARELLPGSQLDRDGDRILSV